jgi:hypothetical protein
MENRIKQERPLAKSLKFFLLSLLPVANCFLPSLICPAPGFGQQVHRNGFEGRTPSWVRASADAPFDETAHQMTNQGPHDGQRAEYLETKAGQGSYVYYQYACGRALISDELSATVWVKANRPGVQLVARVVLPHEPDPNNLDSRLTTMLRGDMYRQVGRWQPLRIDRSVALTKQQQQLMQNQLGRSLNFSDAYVDALLLNVYTGQGVSAVWIDDLEIGPVLDPVTSAPATPPGGVPGALASRTPSRSALVEFNGSQLRVDGKNFFLRGIRHSDTPLKALRDAGFNTVWVEATDDPALFQQAADMGFWLVPSLPVTQPEGHFVSTEALGQDVSRFPALDAVLFWDLGGALAVEQTGLVARSAQLVRGADPGRPIGGDVWDGLLPYSRNLNLVGIHRWPLMTAMELKDYREWLNQRRLLANPGSYVWTWIQTHMPDWYTTLLYERGSHEAFNEPIGPQPEQIRLLTWTALGAGCRGLGFWSDRFLADSHQGRDRLLALALLNQELEMLEPLLLTADWPAQWVDTNIPDIKAAVMRTSKGLLVLPMWLGPGAQYVPGQEATAGLNIVVPQVPQGTQAWEITPGEVRSLRLERVLGGTRVYLPEFGLTTALIFTSDTNLLIRFQEQCRARRQLAAQWSYELAVQELQKVWRVEQQLEKANHTLPDGPALLKDARDRLQVCKDYWDNRRFTDAYREAQRVLRPIRILMRGQWESGIKGLTTPVASPYAVSFYTLPRHWQFMDEVRRGKAGANVLPGGNFEDEPGAPPTNRWAPQETTLDEVELISRRVKEIPPEAPKIDKKDNKAGVRNDDKKDVKKADKAAPTTSPGTRQDLPIVGQQCLMLQIRPKHKEAVPQALERTFLAINSPMVRLQPGTLVKISGWIRIPQTLTATADGALIYDSAGGEPLAYRLRAATPWVQIITYRRVPASGTINVTLALTGIGAVYFDDFKIEPLDVPSPPPSTTTLVGRTASQKPTSQK